MRLLAGATVVLLLALVVMVTAPTVEATFETTTTTTIAETTTTDPPSTTTTVGETTTTEAVTTTTVAETTTTPPVVTTTPPTTTTAPPTTTTTQPRPRGAQTWVGCIPADDSVQVIGALNGTFDSVHYLVTDEDGNVLFEDTDSGTFSARDNGPFLIVNLPGVEGRKVVSTVTADELTDTFTSAGDCVETTTTTDPPVTTTEPPKALPLTGANSVELGALALLLLTSGGGVVIATRKN